MTAIAATPAFAAFETQLRTLCLTEFPCGGGSWRETEGKSLGKKTKGTTNRVSNHFSVTLKDYGAQHEKTELLEEYVKAKKSPWNLDYSWSDEAKQLREIAVKSPWLIDDKFILSHFKTLRIVDKNVSEVDPNLLQFPNLEELTLTANLLETVNSRNLPPNLHVLELCANKIEDLADLVHNPPPLIHLGLGYNNITFTDDYITGEYWPGVLSLDLSHNSLCDLMDIVRKLQTMPKLRNLILQGNPLALVPGYRGYVIDSIRRLDVLDDIRITADEKHHFKGLARRREFILDECKLIIKVPHLNGLLMPDEIKRPDEQPEYPVVTRTYYVQFMIPEDPSSNADVYQITQDEEQGLADEEADLVDAATMQHSDNPKLGQKQMTTITEITEEIADGTELVIEQSQTPAAVDIDRNVAFAAENETYEAPIAQEKKEDTIVEEEAKSIKSESSQPSSEIPKQTFVLEAAKTDTCTWAEEVNLLWAKIFTRDNLLGMRDFLKQGMDIAVIEEKVLSYPVPEEPTEDSRTDSRKDKDGAKKDDKKSGKKDDKSKDKKDEKPKDGEKKKKKKGEPDVELEHGPPEVTVLSTFHLPLEQFLEGEFETSSTFTHEWECEDLLAAPSEADKKEKKKDKEEKKSASKKKDKEKGDKKSAKGKGDDKAKGKAPPITEEEEEEEPPAPLEFSVNVRLHHWKTAIDSVRDDDLIKKLLEFDIDPEKLLEPKPPVKGKKK